MSLFNAVLSMIYKNSNSVLREEMFKEKKKFFKNIIKLIVDLFIIKTITNVHTFFFFMLPTAWINILNFLACSMGVFNS